MGHSANRRCSGSVVPGANGVATAGDLARFYAMMERKGSLDGATVIQSATAEEAVEFQVEGVDKSIGVFAQRSLGLALGDERMGKSTGDPLKTFGPRRRWHVHRMGRLRFGAGRGLYHQRLPRHRHQQRQTGRRLPSRPRRLYLI